ncbi:MAG TPA: chemotaxis protein CheD [Gemmatimonadaceae bacterium]|nr:chemotaxis protein CheD [Gemmatimonadaceae bacterium]
MTEHRVRVADHAVASGEAVIATIGLGSCVAIILHDPVARIGGLAHILLPSEELSRDTSNAAKFPGTAVPLLLEEMRRLGSRGQVFAKVVGGASMFGALLPNGGVNVGERNVASTFQALAAAGIPTMAQDTGGDHGRSVYLHVADGRVVVRSIRKGEIVL